MSQLALGWSQPPQKRDFRLFLEKLRIAGAEKLLCGVELLMHLKSDLQSDFGIVHGHGFSSHVPSCKVLVGK